MGLVLFLLSLVILTGASSWFPPTKDKSCSFTREDSYACLKKYVDVHPKNDEISKKEIDEALSKYLPTYLKPVFWFVSTEKTMEACDYDKNGVITPRDWLMSKEKCFPKKESQCTIQWFCEIAKEQENE